MEIVELLIDEESDSFNGIDAISIVTHPAIEAHGVMLSKDQKSMFAKETEEKGIFIAPILKPDKLIYREKENGDPYQVYFSKDTIRKCAEQFMMESRQWQMTEQHEKAVNEICLVESWIVEDPELDKSKIYNLDVNNGTWCGVFRINNEDVKTKLKSGELQGISIEGYFTDKIETSLEKEIINTVAELAKKGDI